MMRLSLLFRQEFGDRFGWWAEPCRGISGDEAVTLSIRPQIDTLSAMSIQLQDDLLPEAELNEIVDVMPGRDGRFPCI